MLCSERVRGYSVKRRTDWEIPRFNVFWDAKQVLFGFLKLLSAVQKQFTEKKIKNSSREKLLLCFSLLLLHGKGLLPTITGSLTWHWLSSVPLQQPLHAGGVLFCGHSSHTVEPTIRIRPDRAMQALLAGLPWRENFCQSPVETHTSFKMHAHPDCPKSAESTVTTNTAACGAHEQQKKNEFPGPSQREPGEKRGKSCPPCRGWTNNYAALVRDQPDHASPASLVQAAITIIHSTVWARSFPAPSYHFTSCPQF